MEKQRIDALLVTKNFFPTREKARGAIMAGLVWIGQTRVDKPGVRVDENAEIIVKGDPVPFVSRGGLKLDKAVTLFSLTLKDQVCIDIGASTGGFTDCMLQHGAKRVYAVDVGYGQLDWRLRNDSRVVVLERTNIRHVTRDQIPEMASFISIDVSFISLRLVFPVAVTLLDPGGHMVALIKPQFEAGRGQVGKKGVVRDPDVHMHVIRNTIESSQQMGLLPVGLDYSPVKGPKGNIEFLLALRKEPSDASPLILSKISQVVEEAHKNL